MASSERSPSRSEAPAAPRFAAWARRRQGEDCLPLRLERRRIYILPTRAGALTGLILFLILLAGLNYNNSLALLLCFTLTGMALMSMYECHRNLEGLTLQRARIEPTFAGSHGMIELQFANDDSRRRERLALRCDADTTLFNLATSTTHDAQLPYAAPQRGRRQIERIKLSSDAPLRLFRAWTWLHVPLATVIYPEPRGERALPAPRVGRPNEAPLARDRGDEEWAQLRPYQSGDSPQRVAWKAYARGAPLLAALYDAPGGRDRVLDFDALGDLALEARLSQLTRWVLECERRGERYQLRLPAGAPRAAPLVQQRACLEALAVYGL